MNSSEQQKQPDSLQTLVEKLQTTNWLERFGVALRLESLAGEAGEIIEPLHQIVLANKKPAKHTAVWLIKQIGKKTTARWKHRASTLLCPNCIVDCYGHEVRLPESSITFYGCRHCGQSREFLDVSGKSVVVVLDSKMRVKYLAQSETLRVNWLIHRAMVDFDEVQIIQATDEDVERFAVQVGNNTDHTQRLHYREMGCEISLDCQLSVNTIRILEKIFGRVKEMELVGA